MNKFVLLSLFLFAFGIIAVSGRDYMVHGVHYAYGLEYDWAWHSLDLNMYQLELQFVVFASAAVTKSLTMFFTMFVIYELFIWTCTQDLVFYALWHNILRIAPQHPNVFPEGDWVWMPFYPELGRWTTIDQIIFSINILTMSMLVLTYIKQRIKGVK